MCSRRLRRRSRRLRWHTRRNPSAQLSAVIRQLIMLNQPARGVGMRFRILLPLANVVLGVFLFHLGDVQARSLLRIHQEEPLVDEAATARYIHYGMNAPVFVLMGPRSTHWYPSNYWTGHDLRYLLAVALMWFLIGLALDRRFDGRVRNGFRSTWRMFLASLLCLYGLFICYSILPHYGTLKEHFVALWAQVWSFKLIYGLILVWGVALVIVGLRSLFRHGTRQRKSGTLVSRSG
jgi:hypothetical protein